MKYGQGGNLAAAVMAAARRNAERNRAAVDSLRPVARDADQRAEGFRLAKSKPGEIRARAEEMRSLLYIPGFFPTPAAIVARMLDECGNLADRDVLEPSAGRGDIASAARDRGGRVTCYELNGRLAGILALDGFETTEADFLTIAPAEKFDFVVMNPPFEKHADHAHVLHAFKFLRPGGLLVALVGGYTGANYFHGLFLVLGLAAFILTLSSNTCRYVDNTNSAICSVNALSAMPAGCSGFYF